MYNIPNSSLDLNNEYINSKIGECIAASSSAITSSFADKYIINWEDLTNQLNTVDKLYSQHKLILRSNKIIQELVNEFQKYRDRINYVDLKKLYTFVDWASFNINFEKIGVDLTNWDSILFNFIIDEKKELHIIYNLGVEKLNDEFFYKYYENNIPKYYSIGTLEDLQNDVTNILL